VDSGKKPKHSADITYNALRPESDIRYMDPGGPIEYPLHPGR